MAKNDGGPAYPAKVVKENIRGDKRIERRLGMSLRDWFAGRIAAALVGAPVGKFGDFKNADDIASRAYSLADAMLAERDR